MADRNRRKSSILKLPKSNARAPLQDVNTLDVKCSQDDDLTSHTALARRRVSFAGKNFVKEFCSEAEIASVYHAPEYEELLASAESSGLVTSDSSNTHSSTTISENNSTFASRTNLSAYKSISIQGDYDPCDEIMQQFKGTKTHHTQSHKPSGKTRLSFGDICIPDFEEEDTAPPATQAPTGNIKIFTSHKMHDAKENNVMARNIPNTISKSTGVSEVQSVQATSQNINHLGQKYQTTMTKPELHNVVVCNDEGRRSQVDRFTFEEIISQPEHRDSSPSLVGSLVPTPSFEDTVFTNQAAAEAPKISMELISNVDCEPADTTQCMNESMDFTRAVPGIIHLGCLENPVADDKQMQPEQALPSHILVDFQHNGNGDIEVGFPTGTNTEVHEKQKGATNQTVAMDTSMEMTRPLPSNIRLAFASNEIAGIPQKENVMANRTVAMDTSMDITKALPSNIQVGFGSNEIAGIPQKENVMSNRTVAMDTSMEMTRALPTNIQIGFGSNEIAGIPQREKPMANHTVAVDTSMEMTSALPSNIQIGFASNEIAGIPQREKPMANHTVAVDTSMEMTSALPSNIQIGFASNENAGIPQREKPMANHTVAVDTSMEMTRALPSNIKVGFVANEISGMPQREKPMANYTVAVDTSMEITRALPSNIELGFSSNETAGIPLKETAMTNCTVAMDTSMEITRSLPSNIQVDFASNEIAGMLQREKPMANHTVAVDTSMEITRALPSNIELGFSSNETAGIPLKETAMTNRTVAMDTSMEITRSLPSNIQVDFASNEAAGIPQKENDGDNHKTCFKAGSDGFKNVGNDGIQQDFTMHSSVAHHLPTERHLSKMEDSFLLISDPFKSKPCLISSPPTLSGIESVHVQSCSKNVSDQLQRGVEKSRSDVGVPNTSSMVSTVPNESPLSKTCTGTDTFKSKPIPIISQSAKFAVEDVSSLAAPSRTTTNTGMSSHTKEDLFLSRSPDRIAVKTTSEGSGSQITSLKTEQQTDLLDVTNPFKSKSRLINSPIKHSNEFSVHATLSNKEDDKQNSVVKNDDGMHSTLGNVLGGIDKDHCMLLDAMEHPFEDVPSFTMETSASVNDSGANLLHTTIRNAEITLRQMHSPDLEEMQPASGNTLEDMECDLDPIEGTSSAMLPPNEGNSHLCQQTINHEDGGSMIGKSQCEGADKIKGIKSAKRSRNHNLDCEIVDSDRSDDCSLSKRLCTFRPKVVSVECQETSNNLIHSLDQSDDVSEVHSSCSNASSSTELVTSVDDIVLNPRLWKAIKIGADLWSFSFKHMFLELHVHLKISSIAKGIVEGSHGRFVSHVSDSAKPVLRWGMDILMDKLQTKEWDSLLYHSSNFLETLRKINNTVIENKRFLVETIAQEGLLNLKFTPNSFSATIMSVKLHLCFQVIVKLDLLERYTPNHITVKSIFGSVRETEVKNLITGVKKDLYFIRNYIRDIKEYVVTLESFCK